MSKKKKVVHSLEQNIVFQRGHIAENLVDKMLDGLNLEKQTEVKMQLDNISLPLKAHLDRLVKSPKKCVIVEIKTVSAPIDEPYESWRLQVQYQMGLMQEECDHQVDAHILAFNLNTGWIDSWPVIFDKTLFNLCQNKARHIADALKGNVEPKAIIQGYCATCPFKMECPKQGKFAQELPEEIKQDLEFIKKAKKMEKEAKQRAVRVKEFLVNTGVKSCKDVGSDTVVTVRETQTTRFDTYAFASDYPDLHKKYQKTSPGFKMTVL
jgi:CRISPR-associated exonuclease Cas4